MSATTGFIETALTVNRRTVRIEADPVERLTSILRDRLGLKGTKVGCDAGDCGACSVLLDNEVVCACMVAASQLDGRSVTTIEGLGEDRRGRRLQEAFLTHGGAQCGICTPGMLVSAKALLDRIPMPSRTVIEDALGGVLCRCTGYRKIVQAVAAVAGTPATRSATGSLPVRPESFR